MTADQVSQIYQELNDLTVPLTQAPELGLQYLREALMDCRRKQDRVAEILVSVNREQSTVRTNVRALKASVDLARGTPQLAPLKAELGGWADLEDQLKYLLVSVRLRRENLRATSADIRLMANIIEQQIKLGEVQPPKEARRQPAQPGHDLLPFPEDGLQERSLDAEPRADTVFLPKARKPPVLVDDDVDVTQVF